MENNIEEKVNNEENLNELEKEVEKSEIDILNEKIEKLEKDLKEEESKYLRLNAEFQNFSKRKEKELSNFKEMASQKIITEIVPVLENLERAIQSFENIEGNNNSVYDGVKITFNMLNDILTKEGLEIINPISEKFDPMYSQAVSTVNKEELENDIVSSVYAKGYILKGKVIKPAIVEVNKK